MNCFLFTWQAGFPLQIKAIFRLLTNIVLRLFLSFLAQAKIDNSFILLSDKGENQFMSNALAGILEFHIYVSIPLSIFSPSNLHYKTSLYKRYGSY